MSVFDSFSVLSKGKRIAISGIAAVVVIGIIVAVVMIINSGVFSSSMKVLRADGTVNIEDTKGNIKPAKSNMAFRSGDIISTSYDGTAYIGLDNDKTVTLEGYSRASFSKKGKQLELNLITGGLFFEVKNHLNDDESYSIKTTNMSLDIRGTSGYVFYDDTGLQSLIVTDGCVTVEVLNPSSGQRKSAEIHGGQKVTVYLYNMAAGSNNSIKFVVADLRPEDMPEFPLRVLAANKNLLNKVCQYTSWDVEEVQYYINKLPGMNGNPTPTPVLVVQTNTPLPTPTPDPEPTEAPVTPGVTQTVTPTPSSNNDDDDRQTNNNNNSAPKPTNTPKPTAWATPAPTNTPVPTPTNTPTPIPTPSDVPPTPTSEETSEETEPSEETESTEQSQDPEDPTEPEIPEPNEPEGGDN